MRPHPDTTGERLIYEGAVVDRIDETIDCMLNYDIPKSGGMDDTRLRLGNLKYLIAAWPIGSAVNLAVEIVKVCPQMLLKLKRCPFAALTLASVEKRLI